MKLKELLEIYKDNSMRVSIWGKNNLPFCEATAKCHLETTPRLLNCKVLYDGLSNYENEIVVVINKKVRIY